MMIIIIMGGDCNKILLFESSRVRKTLRKKRIVPKDRIKIYARTNTREYCYLVYPRYIGKMVRKTFPLEIWATSICFVPESLTMHHRITELFFPFPPLLFSSLSLLSYFILFFFSFSFNPVLFRSFFTQRLFQYIPDRSLARMITLPDVLLSNTLDSLDFCANLSCMLLVIKFCASLWPSFEVRAMPSFNRFMSCSIE